MTLHGALRVAFYSSVCVCTLWSLACGSSDDPAHGSGGKGGSGNARDAGDISSHQDGGGDIADSGRDAGSGNGNPNQGGTGGSNGSHGGAGGDSAHAGQGGGGTGGSDETDTSSLHIDSFAPTGAEVGGVFRYRVVLDQTGPANYELTSAPDGASIDANGLVTWMPSFNQGGQAHTFSVKASLGEEEATQDFDVSVTMLVLSAEELLDPDSDQLQIISVSSPLSEASGVTLTVPPGALSGVSSISISTTTGAPQMPAQSGAVAPFVLGFGPSGSVFNSPIDLVIPLPTATWQRLLSGEGVASAWTLGSDGVWQSLPIAYVDLENGYVQIKLQHFSLVGLIASPALLTLEHAQLGGSTCPSGLFVSASFTEATLSTGLDQWLNGEVYSKSGLAADAKLKEVLSMLPAGHSLQLRLRALLTDAEGNSKQQQYQLYSMVKRPNGNIDLMVSNEGGNVFYSQHDISPDSSLIDQMLYGDFTHFVFHDYPSMQDGQIALDAFAYLRWPDAPPIVAGSEGQAFASLAQPFTYAELSGAGNDDDCDGIVNDADTTQTLALPPRIHGSSETTLRTTTNTALTLSVNVVSEAAGGVTVIWTGSSPAATLAPTSDGMQASFVSPMPGSYKVTATATDAAGSTSQSFLVIVDSPVTPNTPPRCKINAKRTGAFTGEQIALEAVLEDAEQPNQELSVEWTVAAGATLSSSSARRVSFGSQAPAVYDVTCVARDGLSAGQPTTLSMAVFDRPQNSPPKLNFVAPGSATLQIGNNGLASQLIRVTASDVDNDAVSIQFTLLEGDATLSIAPSPTSALGTAFASRSFETAIPGPYAVLVRAVDENNATSESVVVRLLVAQSLDGTDVDRDGFPASVDCNDGNAKVFPGAPEICGDSIDQNCNGSDQSLADCDADRDGWTANNGDCDDSNPSVFPGAHERCNGRDDNCNLTIDEGYIVGSACSLGVGACAGTGTTVCSSTAAAAVCTAKPLMPTPETCNGIDDNCNGTIDDVPTQGAADVNNCGGCGSVCTGAAHQVPACMPNSAGKLGCAYSCSAGYQDLDRDPKNGCEYSCTNPTKESCNGTDDDCDGRVDEQSDSQFYAGPTGTLGIGECRGGLMICKQGVLVQALAAVTPTNERCDMRDNNCNGKVDEGFDLGGSCDGPDSDLCAYGRYVCGAEGVIVCGLEPNQNIRDVCDGMDNDCNSKTPDGAADPGLNKACDERNPAYCEPGHAACTSGRLVCSNDARDAISCKVCECDTTQACDTNGTGYVCSCDPQCMGPDVECPCDLGSGCDLVDGAEECGCDKSCHGETACSCDQLENKCDMLALGFMCACDDDCGATCGCDASAGMCDKTLSGDACLCDNDCYPSCGCDDKNPDTCAKDSIGNACQCDPSCKPGTGSCACDLTQRACDKDPQTQVQCQCDLDCGPTTCNCNSTSACDNAANGGTCFCDADCSPRCPCDDLNPTVCARDTSGNACQCDPGCMGSGGESCQCDATPDTCDIDNAGNPCGCDKACGSTTLCECDASSGACDTDASGHPCQCDRDCAALPCACDTSMDLCDKDMNQQDCACDKNCHTSMCQCDLTRGVCDKGPNEEPCGCDVDCQPSSCLCDVTKGACDQDCGCDLECQPNTCMCDSLRGVCEKDANEQDCICDKDCLASTCTCDTSAEMCDKNEMGDDCLCDPRCYPPCPCADDDPNTCRRDSDGHVCVCDPGCEKAAPPGCACDKVRGTCDADPPSGSCACDVDCGATPPACGCDTTQTCDATSSNDACLCDMSCYPACDCDDHNPMTCARDSEGNACRCDDSCQGAGTACGCDTFPGTCDNGPNGQMCGCDQDCSSSTCMCNATQGVCDKDMSGANCQCDVDCAGVNTCMCNTTPGVCDKVNGVNCECDVDCSGMNTCMCNTTQGCDKVNGVNCQCDVDCSSSSCVCDVMPNICDVNQGLTCPCDPLCQKP